jgi:hypothetical protein
VNVIKRNFFIKENSYWYIYVYSVDNTILLVLKKIIKNLFKLKDDSKNHSVIIFNFAIFFIENLIIMIKLTLLISLTILIFYSFL